jgi:hypothetical protein
MGVSPPEQDPLLKASLRENDSLEVTMKMMKSLILGSAVAFAATAGAQAADLPVKAKPVAYVKICPTYGPGFYYIPGTDICLKVGGLVFAEIGYYAAGAITTLSTPNAQNAHALAWRSRGYVSMDARTATPYCALRAYILGGFQQVSGPGQQTLGNLAPAAANYAVNNGAFLQYAFIQFAGFTAGTANSFFDFSANYLTLSVASNPWNWTNVFAYTANLGNGLSATISIEDKSTTRVGNGAIFATQNTSQDSPDVVANLRIDQAWGSAQIMAAAHQTRWTNGDDWGWAIGAGAEIKLPMLGAGDTLKIVGVWSEGAVEYTGLSGSPYGGIAGINLGYNGIGTIVTDAAGAVGSLTDASSIMVQYRHFWTPTLRSSFHAGYNHAENLNAGGFGYVHVTQYGHSLAWSPVKDLTLALDVLYTEVQANSVETDKLATWFRVTRTF